MVSEWIQQWIQQLVCHRPDPVHTTPLGSVLRADGMGHYMVAYENSQWEVALSVWLDELAPLEERLKDLLGKLPALAPLDWRLEALAPLDQRLL